MTRFARAHGSKASNERQPEEATSWNVLKQQLFEQQAASKQKLDETSKPTKQFSVSKKYESVVTKWAEFEDVPDPKQKQRTKKKEKLSMHEKKIGDRLSFDEQLSTKSKLHKIKNNSSIQNGTGKTLAKKIKKMKVHTQNSDVPEDKPFVSKAEPKVKLSIQEERKKKRKVLDVNSFTPDSTDAQGGLKTLESVDCSEIKNNSNTQNGTGKPLAKKMKKMKGETRNSHAPGPEDLEPVISKAEPEFKLSIREKRKRKRKVLENSVESFNPDSTDAHGGLKTSKSVDGSEIKKHTNIQNGTGKTLAKKTKIIKVQTQHSDAPEDLEPVVSKAKHKDKLSTREKRKNKTKKTKKIKVQTQHSDAPEDLEPVVSEAKRKDKLPIREKRKNKRNVLENSVKSFNPDSTDAHGGLKTSDSVDGSERKLTKRQLKRKIQMLKKQQDDGFVLERSLKVDKKKKPKQGEPLDDRNDEEGEPKVTERQRNKRKSQPKQQLGSTLSDTPTNIDLGKTDQTQSNSTFQVQSKRQKRNLKKLADPTKVKERRRRKPQVKSITLVINGKEIEVTNFDGFPVRKVDADSLKELRKQMIANGIPAKEIEVTMKMERRKAEKALSQERRKVCFHCRKGGHNLSDCPELIEGSNQDASATSGICFKCGSTEHTHFQCRVVRGDNYRFATCFICHEEGHISRQCPDNPRGLYPKGGGCKVCGDVTHLKKDCPALHEKKEQNAITVDTVRGDRLEALDEDLRAEDNQLAILPPKSKTVKF